MSEYDKIAKRIVEQFVTPKDAEIASLRAEVERLTASYDAACAGWRGTTQERDETRASLAAAHAALTERGVSTMSGDIAMRIGWLANEREARLGEALAKIDDVRASLAAEEERGIVLRSGVTALEVECARLRAEGDAREARGFAAGVEAALSKARETAACVVDRLRRVGYPALEVQAADQVATTLRALRPPAPTLDGDALRKACRDRLDPAPIPKEEAPSEIVPAGCTEDKPCGRPILRWTHSRACLFMQRGTGRSPSPTGGGK